MKKRLVGIMAGISCVMLLLNGCGSKEVATETAKETTTSVVEEAETEVASTGDNAETLDGILSGTTLIIGTDTSFVPFCFQGEDGEYTGFDIELMKAFSEKLGFTYELKPMDFTALLMSVESKKVDVGIAGITIKAEREEVMDFSLPYYDAGLLIMVAKDNEDITSIADLSGKVIALKEGTSSVDYVNTNVEGAKEVKTFPNIENAYMEVERGAADAVVYDSPNILYYLSQKTDSNCKPVGDMFDAAQYGVLFPDGSELTNYFNEALEEFRVDGTYDAIYSKWFGIQQ